MRGHQLLSAAAALPALLASAAPSRPPPSPFRTGFALSRQAEPVRRRRRCGSAPRPPDDGVEPTAAASEAPGDHVREDIPGVYLSVSGASPRPEPALPWMRPLAEEEEEKPWFMDLRSERMPFSCTGCGRCCKTRGDVYLSPSEAKSAAELLGLSVSDFKGTYAAEEEITVSVALDAAAEEEGGTGWVLLRHKPSDGSCVFLDGDNMCSIYGARPLQCSTYPFWPRIVSSREGWNDEVRLKGDPPQPGLAGDGGGGENRAEGSEGRYWTPEGGGCEGMGRVEPNGTTAHPFGDGAEEGEGVVSPSEALVRLRLYERYRRMFPWSEFRPVRWDG